MSLLVIIRGLPGSGKSTLAAKIQPDPGCVCEADKFMVDAAGNYSFNRDRLSFCHDMCQAKVRSLLEQGAETIVVSNTNIREWEFQPYLDLAKEYAALTQIISISPDDNWESVHNVPDEVVTHMRAAWFEEGYVG
jgi:predicted kinase